jgi:hypothetical protein
MSDWVFSPECRTFILTIFGIARVIVTKPMR